MSDDLDARMRAVLTAFGDAVVARRPDVRASVEQPPSFHYASSTLVGFLWDHGEDDLVVASAILDTRTQAPTWMINITTGAGTPIAELVVDPLLARDMASDAELAAKTCATFLDERLGDVLSALPAHDIYQR